MKGTKQHRCCARCGIRKPVRTEGAAPRTYLCRDCNGVLTPLERVRWRS